MPRPDGRDGETIQFKQLGAFEMTSASVKIKDAGSDNGIEIEAPDLEGAKVRVMTMWKNGVLNKIELLVGPQLGDENVNDDDENNGGQT